MYKHPVSQFGIIPILAVLFMHEAKRYEDPAKNLTPHGTRIERVESRILEERESGTASRARVHREVPGGSDPEPEDMVTETRRRYEMDFSPA
jgi:hypothetical protein